jgi:hypothetical protein
MPVEPPSSVVVRMVLAVLEDPRHVLIDEHLKLGGGLVPVVVLHRYIVSSNPVAVNVRG